MRKILWLASLVVVAWFLTSCDEVDVTSEGGDAYVEDTASYDANVEPDESSPDDVSTDAEGGDVLTAEEACTPYLGTWYCSCGGGSCTGSVFVNEFSVDVTQKNKGIWTLSLQEVNDDLWGLITCNPTNLPPSDQTASLTLQIIDPPIMEIVGDNYMGGLVLTCHR